MSRVFLDTCVLFPPILRRLLLTLADAGLFTPLWSDGIEAEWLHVTARKGEDGAADALAQMRARWPSGLAPAGDPDWLDLPDPGDRHVLAAAIAGEAAVLLTLNRRDFPKRMLEPHAIVAQTPDDFVMELWLKAPETVEAGVAQVWPGRSGAELRKALKKADLPRLGRAMAAR